MCQGRDESNSVRVCVGGCRIKETHKQLQYGGIVLERFRKRRDLPAARSNPSVVDRETKKRQLKENV